MQKIKLLTPNSNYMYLEVERNPEWFKEPSGSFYLEGDEAVFHHATGDTVSVGDLMLVLEGGWIEGIDDEPDTWQFSLSHEEFSGPMYEWESEVPDEALPEVRIECNDWREMKALWADRKAATTEEDEDDEDDADSWKNA